MFKHECRSNNSNNSDNSNNRRDSSNDSDNGSRSGSVRGNALCGAPSAVGHEHVRNTGDLPLAFFGHRRETRSTEVLRVQRLVVCGAQHGVAQRRLRDLELVEACRCTGCGEVR